MKSIFCLMDCNNFFVSCERLFRPDLQGRPVVVLSSNDGCVVSRSNEAKALGIPMGAPVFKYRQLFERHRVVKFSANFELYGDVSERITRLLTGITPRIEIYSVDEAFLDLSRLEIKDYGAWGRLVRQRLLKEIGIPVAVGIAPTKTLAKLAAERAKKDAGLGDSLDLTGAGRQAYLRRTPVKDIWGIGWRLAPKLRGEGIFTALDVARMRPQFAQQLMGVRGRQLVAELNGTACYPLEMFGKIRQTIMHGRQFGQDTRDLAVLQSAIASLAARAAHGLRRDKLLARQAMLNLSTNRHKPGYQILRPNLKFATPTADTGYITSRLVEELAAGFNPKLSYHRADVLFYDLVPASGLQADMFGSVDMDRHDRSQARLAAVDALNAQYGKGTVRYAAENLSDSWQPRRGSRSPRYTTCWKELPVIGQAAVKR